MQIQKGNFAETIDFDCYQTSTVLWKVKDNYKKYLVLGHCIALCIQISTQIGLMSRLVPIFFYSNVSIT